MKDKRQYERFSFPLPVKLKAITTDRQKVIDLYT